ncbi:MAG: phosphoribosylformylglycinamidine synthase, purS protein [Marine Group III euryarchaeote CG-Epi3]|jgi:phosphoribosylformylglycinamidine synthase|uniref:Phosphoribosylformylglycinamidine synthase subunit PurS n=1 Tax=Marine Group III euryarchaeote CG-Epi3 TaxID=1888997 RepID=A0A1J5TRN5_9ARCH|nr:MAG: phosphoribosylformylglycinamidine synthase, purS protein [Marine Group III euryarchaeote CG-Epi3]|tara:strand:+ start:1622 stop:1867 length:246 start_codon:yes stop_codon:yes gene_type:complete
MTTEIEIQVGLKSGMADPEGANVKKALDLLGFDSVENVNSVKCYRIIIDKEEADAMKEAEDICKKLLANPVVHEYSISVAK